MLCIQLGQSGRIWFTHKQTKGKKSKSQEGQTFEQFHEFKEITIEIEWSSRE